MSVRIIAYLVTKKFIWLKKSISILLLGIYLFSNFHLVELVKMPVLLEHYDQHKKWNEKSTFLEFLFLHYQDSLANHSDYDLDKKLPFLSGQDHTAIWIAPVLLKPTFIFQPAASYRPAQRNTVYLTALAVSCYLSGIWQPPKYC